MIRLMIFIDGTWLYSNLKHLAKETSQPAFYIDYGALPLAIRDEVARMCGDDRIDLVRTFFFGSYPVNYDIVDEDRARKRTDFFKLLREDYNYEVESYPIDYQRRRILHDDREEDDQFTPREKCVDIALASAMFHNAMVPGAYDIAAAVVGDKDYFPLFQRVRQLGKRVALASIRQSCAKIYADRQDEKRVKDFQTIWLNDIIESIMWRQEEYEVECRSPLHEGPRRMITTVRLKEGQPFYCDTCRARFAEQKAEQMRELTSAGLDNNNDEYNHGGGYNQVEEVYEGVIDNVIQDRGYGFIKRSDGASFFFHLTHLTNVDWENITTGVRARFTVTKNPVGTKAGAAGEVTLVFDE